jgi:hypothetical protein
MQVINVELKSDVNEADTFAIQALLDAGREMADRDWKQVLGTRGDAANA